MKKKRLNETNGKENSTELICFKDSNGVSDIQSVLSLLLKK